MTEVMDNVTVPACPGNPPDEELLWEREVSGQIAYWLDAVVGTVIAITGFVGEFSLRFTCGEVLHEKYSPSLVELLRDSFLRSTETTTA